jgi:hypothetical protein
MFMTMRMAIMAMIMRVAMMIMRMAMVVIMIVVMIMRIAMVVIMIVVMIMCLIVTTATSRTMSMMVTVIMVMIVMTVIMAMAVMIMAVITMCVIMIGAALGLEGTRHGRHRASQATDHFGEHMIVFDIDCVRRDLSRCMTIADMPSGFQKPHWIFSFDFDQRLRCGFDENERAILELDRIAIIQGRGLFKIEQKRRALLARKRDASAMPPFMIKTHLINHFIGFDGGFAHNRSGPLHEIIPFY